MKHISYHKIPQFRDIIKQVNHLERFRGLDEEGIPIYDEFVQLPVLTFIGTVKLHGTNASICFNDNQGIWIQSRNQIKNDGFFGFPLFVRKNEELFKEYFDLIKQEYKIDTSKCTISIYGEWAGNGIQKNVAISDFNPSFFIFDIKVSPCCNGTQFESYYLDITEFPAPAHDNIYSIYQFDQYLCTIDFNNTDESYDSMMSITDKVEERCPVAYKLGKEGIGEGIVWKCNYKDQKLVFKTKGEKHSTSGIKKSIKEFSSEKRDKIKEFVNNVVNISRIEQAIHEVKLQEELDEITIKQTGKILAWCGHDIKYEEESNLIDLNLDWKEVSGEVNNQVRKLFFEWLNKN